MPSVTTRLIASLLASAGITAPVLCQPGLSEIQARRAMHAQAHQPVVQLAICLDTSGSMDGLLHQARTRIWSIVNELGRVRHFGVVPRLEVALYQYGSSQQPAEENFTACILPFTSDLDAVSEALFALTIAGSSEYCGAAIQSASQDLAWTATGEGALRVLVIAGNEPFTQGPVDYRQAVPDAVERGIVINTIYCGRDAEGQATGWLHAAHLAGGDYAVIEQDKVLDAIPCPQDDRLRELNAKLNSTYLYYGHEGAARVQRQAVQDKVNEVAEADAFYSRVASKSGANYRNVGWDLVDLYTDQGAEAVAAVDRDTLPEDFRVLGDSELLAVVESRASERSAIRSEIQTLTAQREQFLAEARSEQGEDASGTLDNELIRSIRKHAERAGFSFDQ